MYIFALLIKLHGTFTLPERLCVLKRGSALIVGISSFDNANLVLQTERAPKILVTGAAGGKQGATGRVLTHLLLDRGVHVRAMVRTDDDRAAQLRTAGAEVRPQVYF